MKGSSGSGECKRGFEGYPHHPFNAAPRRRTTHERRRTTHGRRRTTHRRRRTTHRRRRTTHRRRRTTCRLPAAGVPWNFHTVPRRNAMCHGEEWEMYLLAQQREFERRKREKAAAESLEPTASTT